jgi:hypothetical protein
MLKLNPDKLPIKFILGIEKDLPSWPEPIDVLHYVVDRANKYPDRFKDTFTLHSVATYYCPGREEILKESIDLLIIKGWIAQTKDEPGKEAYQILSNPFE